MAKAAKPSDTELAMETVHRMSVFIEHHFPSFDLEAEGANFYTNAEGSLVYIPPQGSAAPAQAEVPTDEPQPEPQPEPAPEPDPEPDPEEKSAKPKPKTEAQKVLQSGASSTGSAKPKLDPSQMGIHQHQTHPTPVSYTHLTLPTILRV